MTDIHVDVKLSGIWQMTSTVIRCGSSCLVVDPGYFPRELADLAGLGDWYVDEHVWPQGLHPLVQRVHELGMEFGLWRKYSKRRATCSIDLSRSCWRAGELYTFT